MLSGAKPEARRPLLQKATETEQVLWSEGRFQMKQVLKVFLHTTPFWDTLHQRDLSKFGSGLGLCSQLFYVIRPISQPRIPLVYWHHHEFVRWLSWKFTTKSVFLINPVCINPLFPYYYYRRLKGRKSPAHDFIFKHEGFIQHTIQITSSVKVVVDFQVFQIQERAEVYPYIWIQS